MRSIAGAGDPLTKPRKIAAAEATASLAAVTHPRKPDRCSEVR